MREPEGVLAQNGVSKVRGLIGRALLVAAFLGGLCVAASANILITIDKSTQRMNVVVDGAPKYNWPVSTGAMGYTTPSGTFRPFRMEADYFSKEWDDAPMPHAIFFTGRGHAIHGSFSKRIGTRASHGCVRLSPGNAATLYALVASEGMAETTVVVRGGGFEFAGGSPFAGLKAPELKFPKLELSPGLKKLFHPR